MHIAHRQDLAQRCQLQQHKRTQLTIFQQPINLLVTIEQHENLFNSSDYTPNETIKYMGCGQAKAAKVEDTYAIPEGTKSDTELDELKKTVSESVQELDELKKTVSESVQETITEKSEKQDSPNTISSKSDKDDSDWVPTIDTDIFNAAGGGRIKAEEVAKEDTNEQTLV